MSLELSHKINCQSGERAHRVQLPQETRPLEQEQKCAQESLYHHSSLVGLDPELVSHLICHLLPGLLFSYMYLNIRLQLFSYL